jgi:hypothetical protein
MPTRYAITTAAAPTLARTSGQIFVPVIVDFHRAKAALTIDHTIMLKNNHEKLLSIVTCSSKGSTVTLKK